MAKIRRRRGTAMENEPNQNQKIENMKALMMQLACSYPSKLPYKDLIEEKIQMLMMRLLPDHPTYASMIDGALHQLKEEQGSTEEAISSSIVERFDDLPLAHATFLKHHLKQLVEKKEIVRTSGNRYMHMGSIARSEITESRCPKSAQQLEETEGQKQGFSGKGSEEADEESRGEEQPIQAIDDRTKELPVLTEECNEELREHTDMIMGQTVAGKRMADESIHAKGQHNDGVNLGREKPTEVTAARQEPLRLKYVAAEMLPLGEEQIKASDERHHPEQQVDDIGYRNRLEDLKRLQEQQNDFCDKITELYTMVENIKKSKKVDDPGTISSSSVRTDLRLNQSCSLPFSMEEGLRLMSKLTGANHQLAEILNSSTLVEASKLGLESVVRGQQRDSSAKNSLPTPAPFQGTNCNHISGCKPQDKQNQRRSYCRRASTKSGMKTMSPDIDVDSLQLQEKSLNRVSHSKRHPDSEGTLVKSFKRKKKTQVSPEGLEETSMGWSDHVKPVDQSDADAMEPSTPGSLHPEEHLKDTETTEKVKTRMQNKISGEAKEPTSTIVSEQLHQQQGNRQLTVTYSRGKRGPGSAVEDDSSLADFFPPKKRAKKGTKMKLKHLDKEQQEQLVMIEMPREQGMLVGDATMDPGPVGYVDQLHVSIPRASVTLPISWDFYHGFKPAVEGTLERGKTTTEMSSEKQQQAEEPEHQACSKLLGEKSSEQPGKKKQIKGKQQQRLLRSQAKRPWDSGVGANVVEELASAQVQDDHEHLENTEFIQKSKTRRGKNSSQCLDQKPNKIASEQLCHPLQQGQGLGQLRQIQPHGITSPELLEIGTTEIAGVSSPENPVEQNVQFKIDPLPHKEIQEPGSPPTNLKRRGRPPGKGKKLKKKVQKQHPGKRGRPCKVKTGIKTTGKLRNGKKETRGRPRKIKLPIDTSTNELSSQDKNQPEESEPQGDESVSDIDKQQCGGKGTPKAKPSQNHPKAELLRDKVKSEPDQPLDKVEHPEKAADATNEDHLQGRDMIILSPEQGLQTLKSSEGRITRSRLAGP